MPIVFRCYQCNQVLKTARSKIGAVVPCPKCKAELVVPEPPPQAANHEGAEGANDAAEVIRSVVAIQAEELSQGISSPGRRKASVRPEGGLPREVPLPTVEHPFETSDNPAPTPPTGGVVDTSSAPPIEPAAKGAAFPEIQIEPQPILARPSHARQSDYAPGPRSRDVVLSRAAIAGWSLFAILGLFLAFIAGLLAGHFLWVTKIVKV
jgi:hypothetical protein